MKKPNVNSELAKELVFRLYGLKVINIKEMVSYDDQNFHIQVASTYKNPHITDVSPDGYTLKIQNPVKTAISGYIESTHEALKFISEKGLKVPVPIPNVYGATWCQEILPLRQAIDLDEKIDNQERCGIHLLSYIPGQPVNTVTYTKDILLQWGQLLAKFQNCLQEFRNDDLYNKHIWWTLPHLLEIADYISDLDEDRTTLVWSVFKKYEEIQSDIAKMPKGFIHGDFNETNVLINKELSEYAVNGILDLEHVHHNTYVWDVGVMLAYVSLGCDCLDPIEGMGYALAGYLQFRKLTAEEITFLKICIASRLCQTLIMGAYNFKLDPSNPYIIIAARSGWHRLKLIWKTPDEQILKIWTDIQKNVTLSK